MNINPDSAKEIPCKNVLIFGYCKYENKGCVFAHPDDTANTQTQTQATSGTTTSRISTDSGKSLANQDDKLTAFSSYAPQTEKLASADVKRKFNLNTPSFQPSVQGVTSKFAALSPKLKEIPVFVPSGMDLPAAASPLPIGESNQASQSSFTARKFNASTPSFTPSNPLDSRFAGSSSNIGLASNSLMAPTQSAQLTQPPKQQNPYLTGSVSQVNQPAANSLPQGSDFMYHNQTALAYPLNYHLYAPAPPPRLAAQMSSHETNVNAMFIPNDLRESLTKKNEATLQTMALLSLPEHVGVYHSLVPIDSSFDQLSTVYQLPSCVYKVLSNVDGQPYVLRRIDFSSRTRILNDGPFATIKKWTTIKSPNVIRLHDAFTTVSLASQGEPTLCLAYDFYPMASTLQEQHITRKLGTKLEPISEDVLWTYLIQLTGGLITIHEAGLHAGSSISMSKILVTNRNRVRLGAVGVDDILDHDLTESRVKEQGASAILHEMQMADVARFGKLMIDLAGLTLPVGYRGLPAETIIKYLRTAGNPQLSPELLDALESLAKADDEFDLTEFYRSRLSLRMLRTVNGLQDLSDYFESQLLSEVENARLFRLLAKISFLLDRPDSEGELAKSGFIIKSFKDYLFQTCDEYGKPLVDLSRVLTNLNKLDVGIDEKLLLVSREEDSCIIISYKEIKEIIDVSFRSLTR